MQNITLDGVWYRVRIVFPSMTRAFSIIEGPNSGMSITSRAIRDIAGTSYSYEMRVEPDPLHPEDYDAFYEAISAPVESHIVELPYGEDSRQFEMMVLSGSDVFSGKRIGRNTWKNLTVQFKPIAPQRTE